MTAPDCNGFELSLKSCYRLMDSLRFRPDIFQESLCDDLFHKYCVCLKVIYIFIFNYYIIGMNQILWMNVNYSKKTMTNVLILGSGTNFLKETMMTLCVQSS